MVRFAGMTADDQLIDQATEAFMHCLWARTGSWERLSEEVKVELRKQYRPAVVACLEVLREPQA